MTLHDDQQPAFLLYSFRRCPYAMRARMALKVSGANPVLREIILRDQPDHMLTLSSKGTVPVLRLENGDILEESLDIMYWALAQHDPEGWLTQRHRSDIDALITENDTLFKAALDRYKYPNRFEDEDCSGARDTCQSFFDKLNLNIQNHGGGLLTDSYTMADIAIFPFIRQAAFVNKAWFDGLELPHLHRWFNTLITHRHFVSIMPKIDVWSPDKDAIYFQNVMTCPTAHDCNNAEIL
jgi:glutathione S-transferase